MEAYENVRELSELTLLATTRHNFVKGKQSLSAPKILVVAIKASSREIKAKGAVSRKSICWYTGATSNQWRGGVRCCVYQQKISFWTKNSFSKNPGVNHKSFNNVQGTNIAKFAAPGVSVFFFSVLRQLERRKGANSIAHSAFPTRPHT